MSTNNPNDPMGATMSDTVNTDDLFGGEDAPKTTEAPKAEPKPAAKTDGGKPKRAPRRVPQEIDNAVDITHVHWECPCGNTNAFSLERCGKCNDPRFTQE